MLRTIFNKISNIAVIISNKFIRELGFEIRNTVKKDIYQLQPYHDLYPEESIINKRFYNIGAGKFRHPFWTNIDLKNEWYATAQKDSTFINYDLFSLKKLPIPDNYAEIVYSSHTIEHINDKAAQNMFNEVYRIIKEGGIFRIITPNIDLEYRAFRDNDINYFYWINRYSQINEVQRIKLKIPMNKASIEQIFLHHFASYLSELFDDDTLPKISNEELHEIFSKYEYEEALNHITSRCSLDKLTKIYFGNHMNWWNEKKAFRMLKEAGFNEIYRSGYGQSFCPILRNLNLFDNTDPKTSLYIEAIKR